MASCGHVYMICGCIASYTLQCCRINDCAIQAHVCQGKTCLYSWRVPFLCEKNTQGADSFLGAWPSTHIHHHQILDTTTLCLHVGLQCSQTHHSQLFDYVSIGLCDHTSAIYLCWSHLLLVVKYYTSETNLKNQFQSSPNSMPASIFTSCLGFNMAFWLIKSLYWYVPIPDSPPSRQLPPTVSGIDKDSRAAFPLSMGHAPHYVKPRIALVG